MGKYGGFDENVDYSTRPIEDYYWANGYMICRELDNLRALYEKSPSDELAARIKGLEILFDDTWKGFEFHVDQR